MNTEEMVIQQEYQDSKIGNYQIQSYNDDTGLYYNSTPGANWNGKQNRITIDDDTYLKNLQVKNSKTIVGNNNFLNRMSRVSNILMGAETLQTKTKKTENNKREPGLWIGTQPIDIPKRNLGIDSRHIHR